MKLSIIVLSYNTRALTVNCFKSIGEIYKSSLGEKIELILSDNASEDKTSEAVESLKLRVKIVKNDKNLGFSKGNNQGVKKAIGRYLFFLNSDTEIKDDGILRMVDFMEKNSKVGILGAKLLNKDGSSQKSAGSFYNLFQTLLSLLGLERLGLVKKSPKETEKVDWVSGAALMIRADLFRKLRGFDEKIFMYMEDVDLCFRANEIGFKTYFYPNINLIHREHGSSNRAFAINQIYQGLLYFYRKHKPYWQYFAVKGLLIGKALIAVTIGGLMNNNYLKKTYGQALRLAI